ncbi:MAG: orotidine-5'-phosphate decarboxylase [Pseudomonadota bacterium]
MTDKPVIVALDAADQSQALALAGQLDPARCRVKVGKELFTAAGPDVVDALHTAGFDVFLDLKFHDIPNTVEGACRVVRRLGVWMLTVHASGGDAMLRAAREGLGSDVKLVGVTVLTSLDAGMLAALGVTRSLEDQVDALARSAIGAGLDGVVCSAHEAARLRGTLGAAPLLVTPGIRPQGTDAGDQARVMTPERAVAAGASYLVIGRAITGAPQPARQLADINRALAAG